MWVDFVDLGGWPGLFDRVIRGDSLSESEASCVMGRVLGGEATAAQIGGLLVGLRSKGETVEEITGFVRAMQAHAEPLVLRGDLAEVVDVVGTGGDRLRSINVSTIAAFIVAGAGVPVCKHGNRAASSSVGTADVLEALGVVVELDGSGVARCLDEAGMGFCFARRFHPAMRHVAAVRSELGVPTIFNFLGPLANPARVQRQLVGGSDPAMAAKMIEVLGITGSRRSMVVYADDGLDELSVTSPSTVLDLRGDGDGHFEVQTYRVDPTALGFRLASMDDLRGGDAAFNADVIRSVLDGEHGARRDIGVLNAAAALVVAGRAETLATGVELAQASLTDGRARRVLDELIRVSRDAAGAPSSNT